jgi:hypothetical protein
MGTKNKKEAQKEGGKEKINPIRPGGGRERLRVPVF